MSDSDLETDFSPEVLSAGREAGMICLRAFKETVEAASKAASGETPDFPPYLFAQFAALRNGWYPISRCWPKLRLNDVVTTCYDQIDIRWKTLSPPIIWLLVRNLFWRVVWHTKYRGPACDAWCFWHELQLPSAELGWDWVPSGPEIEQFPWHLIRSLLADYALPPSWDDSVTAINESPSGSTQDLLDLPEVPFKFVRIPSWHIITPRKLPLRGESLERLLGEADELMAYYSDRKLECSKIAARYEARLKRTVAGEETVKIKRRWAPAPPPIREVTDYAAPIYLAACSYDVLHDQQYLEYLWGLYSKRDDGTTHRREEPKQPGICLSRKELRSYKQAFRGVEQAIGHMIACLEELEQEIQNVLKEIHKTPKRTLGRLDGETFMTLPVPEKVRIIADLEEEQDALRKRLAERERQPTGKTPDPLGEVEEEHQKLLENCGPCERKAYLAYEHARKHLEIQETKVTDEAAYQWLKDNGPDEFPLPNKFTSWARYVRAAREALGKQINSPRPGRTGGSIKRPQAPESELGRRELTPEEIRGIVIDRLGELVGDISVCLAKGRDPKKLWKQVEDDLKALDFEENEIRRIVDANKPEDLLAIVETLDRK